MSQEDTTPPPHAAADDPFDGILASAHAYAEEQEAVRNERRRRFASIMPEPQRCVVAWIDLLGFRAQIKEANTPETFQAAYRRLRDVHEEFGKESASPHADQAELNAGMGKRVVALSDGLVIALNLEDDSPSAQVSHLYDRIGFFLEELRFAQARCASMGNFVRGGVDLGYFWFEDDIMLSPALVEAYEMESKKNLAKNPVIILKRDFSEAVRDLKTKAGHSKKSDPMHGLFRDCEWMAPAERRQHVMLNFMPVFAYDGDPTPWLRRYRERLSACIASAQDGGVRAKYQWLMEYAREFVRERNPASEASIFGETAQIDT